MSWYTPPAVLRALAIEPAAGTGQFLVTAGHLLVNPPFAVATVDHAPADASPSPRCTTTCAVSSMPCSPSPSPRPSPSPSPAVSGAGSLPTLIAAGTGSPTGSTHHHLMPDPNHARACAIRRAHLAAHDGDRPRYWRELATAERLGPADPALLAHYDRLGAGA